MAKGLIINNKKTKKFHFRIIYVLASEKVFSSKYYTPMTKFTSL